MLPEVSLGMMQNAIQPLTEFNHPVKENKV